MDPGAVEVVALALAENDPTTRRDLTLLVTSIDGKVVFHRRQSRWAGAKEPFR